MLLYNETLKQFKLDVSNNQVMKKMKAVLNVGSSEINSWVGTINFMYIILNNLNISEKLKLVWN